MADLTYFHGVEITEGGSIDALTAPPAGGGSVEPPTPDPTPSLDFSESSNSQYVGQVI